MSNADSFISESSSKESSQKNNKATGQLADEGNNIQETSLSRKVEFEKGLPLSFGFADNKIFTIPFNFRGYLSFIGNKISEAPVNICMIVVFIYYLIAFLVDMDNFGNLEYLFSISVFYNIKDEWMVLLRYALFDYLILFGNFFQIV